VLGIGASHKIMVEGMLGERYARAFTRAFTRAKETLLALKPLLAGEVVSLEGDEVVARGRIGFEAPPCPILVAALGEKMLELASREANGVTLYDGELDKSRRGLAPVAQVATYKGFVFGTHDATAPPLENYLGATGRLGLDLIAERGDMAVVPGIQKFVVDCNWKITVDSVFDWYHPQVSHASAFRSGALGPAGAPSRCYEQIDMTPGRRFQAGSTRHAC
jgi:hypothetical protein